MQQLANRTGEQAAPAPAPPPVEIRPDRAAAADLDPVTERLASRIAWYDRTARRHHELFTSCKVLTLLAATTIPFVSGLGAATGAPSGPIALLSGLLGATIVVVEGLQQLFQWQQSWLSYRATSEVLERERSLYAARAGPYRLARDPHRLLAERAEAIMAQEQATWLALSEESSAKRPDT